MKWTTVFLLSFGMPLLCRAARPLPWVPYCNLLDEIGSLAASQSKSSPIALNVLERVALGRTGEIDAESAAQVGVPRDHLGDWWFSAPEVRACAFRKIGETGAPEALKFLTNLKPADVSADTDIMQQVWPVSQVALRDITLRGIQNPQLQIEFLERTATQMARADEGDWAFNELCDRGALGSLVVVQQAIRKRRNGQRDEDEIAFCEARIRVLYGKPDRVKALASVLSLGRAGENPRLTEWAIDQLATMHSREAHAELDRFANEIARMPAASPGRERLLRFREDIRISPRASER